MVSNFLGKWISDDISSVLSINIQVHGEILWEIIWTLWLHDEISWERCESMDLLPCYSSILSRCFLIQEISVVSQYFIHVLSIMIEEEILLLLVLKIWMNKWEMFFNFSLIDNFYQLKIIEVLLCLLNERDLWLNVTFSEIWMEEVVLIVVVDWLFALQENLSEFILNVESASFIALIDIIIGIILSGFVKR